ncbi:MAG: NUDIX domain-containing protein [Candidatus Aenigmarchaeota archaeon]|nr:NUDIX domain-containing protein [Candidatus Aenigmarchaeota archaeon]MBU5688846.1 NUDIX domain-containing protein [Candidatus Aenigmarchaeota archaeon]
MDKNEKLIMVVDREKLFAKKYFNGFLDAKEEDYEKIILKNYYFVKRGLAEKDYNKKQPIPYAIIVKEKQIFAYQRASSTKEHGDERLQHKWSWGIGGHIEKTDDAGNPIKNSMSRELEEEVGLKNPKAMLIGYINDDSDDVGKVHFGLIYLIKTSQNLKPTSPELQQGSFLPISKIEEIAEKEQVESWSKIALLALKPLFS